MRLCLLLVSVLLFAAAQVPMPISDVLVDQITSTSAMVLWGALNQSDVTGFSVSVAAFQNMTGASTAQVNATTTAYQLVNLTAGQWVYVSVSAINAAGTSTGNAVVAVLPTPGSTNVFCNQTISIPWAPAFIGGQTQNVAQPAPIDECSFWGARMMSGVAWYSFVAPATATMTIDNCADLTSFDAAMNVYTQTTAGDCSTNMCETTQQARPCTPFPMGKTSIMVAFDAVMGSTYLFAIGGFQMEYGTFSLRLTAGALPSAVTGLTASHVTSGAITLTWDPAANAEYYIVNVNGTEHIFIYAVTFVVSEGIVADTTYEIFVYAANIAGAGEPSSSILVTTLPGTGNDACAAPQVLPSIVPTSVTGMLAGAAPASGVEYCTAETSNLNALWFAFTVPMGIAPGQLLSIDSCSNTHFDSIINLYEGDCNDSTVSLQCLTGNDDGCASGSGSVVSFSATPNTTYMIMLTTFFPLGHSEGRFNLTVRMAVPPGPVEDLAVAYVTADSVSLTWSPPYNPTDELVTYTIAFTNSSGDTRVIALKKMDIWNQLSPMYTIYGLAAGSTYTFAVYATNSVGISQVSPVINVTTVAPLPGNTCSFPMPAQAGGHYYARLQGALIPSNLTFCHGYHPSLSATTWFAVQGTGGPMHADTCTGQTKFDTVMYVFTGACGNLQCIEWNDDNLEQDRCGLSSSVQWDSVAGTTYYILVMGYGGNAQSFVLNVNTSGSIPGDNCEAAVEITTMPMRLPSDYANASSIVTPLPSCVDQNQVDPPNVNTPAIWFRLTLPTTNEDFVVSTCDQTTAFDAQLVLVAFTEESEDTCDPSVWTCPAVTVGTPISCPFSHGNAVVVAAPVYSSAATTTLYAIVFANGPLNRTTFSLNIDHVPPVGPTPTIVSTTSRSMVISWPPANVDYDVDYILHYSSSLTPHRRIQMGNALQWTLDSLPRFTPFTLHITTETVVGQGAPSAFVVQATLADPPAPVLGLALDGSARATGSSIPLVWTVPMDFGGVPADGIYFNIIATDADNLATVVHTPPVSQLVNGPVTLGATVIHFALTGLTKDKFYLIRVNAQNSDGISGDAIVNLATAAREDEPVDKPRGMSGGAKAAIAMSIVGVLTIALFATARVYNKRRNAMYTRLQPDAPSVADVQGSGGYGTV